MPVRGDYAPTIKNPTQSLAFDPIPQTMVTERKMPVTSSPKDEIEMNRTPPHLHAPGLLRLWERVRNPAPKKEHMDAKLRRTRLALAWSEGDTVSTVLARHPELAEDAAALSRQMDNLRGTLGAPWAHRKVAPWQVAHAYLATRWPNALLTVVH
jgi:hypothetical protein